MACIIHNNNRQSQCSTASCDWTGPGFILVSAFELLLCLFWACFVCSRSVGRSVARRLWRHFPQSGVIGPSGFRPARSRCLRCAPPAVSRKVCASASRKFLSTVNIREPHIPLCRLDVASTRYRRAVTWLFWTTAAQKGYVFFSHLSNSAGRCSAQLG